jgi:hypothetical protein
MDITLRILHIIFGVYFAGIYIFATLILLPRLSVLGPAIERPVLRAVLSPTALGNITSGLITLGTGVIIAVRLHGGSLDTYIGTGWRLAMLVALTAFVVAKVLKFVLLFPLGQSMERLNRSIEGRDHNANEARQLDQYIARFRTVGCVNLMLILLALAAMPVARFI